LWNPFPAKLSKRRSQILANGYRGVKRKGDLHGKGCEKETQRGKGIAFFPTAVFRRRKVGGKNVFLRRFWIE